ncbi:hypothetical protein ACOBQB_10035 [Streptomyces sp. G5(2025)]|uniref:hypothetical protein n=1 Tax=Streptomyces sp. G5(2025) TaxID=3406628 RepID=UPI003C13A95B
MPRKQPLTPAELSRMSPLELRAFAYLAWASAAHRQVSYRDVGRLSLPSGDFIGVRTAVKVVQDLADSGLLEVHGVAGILHAPLSVHVAGHQPRPARAPQSEPTATAAPAHVPAARDRFTGAPDPGAAETIPASQVRGPGWSTLPEPTKLRRRLWGVVHGKGPMICSRAAQFKTSKGRPPTVQELAGLLGWQDGTPVTQALGRLIQTGWLVQTPHGLLRVGPAYEKHLAGAAKVLDAACGGGGRDESCAQLVGEDACSPGPALRGAG